jgi:F-type H+-transporting ATPase subunit beta
VKLSDTIEGFRQIIAGDHDEIPEGMFLSKGTIDEVVEEYKASQSA